MKLAPLLLLLLTYTTAHAQNWLGLSVRQLHELYASDSVWSDWQQGKTSVGRSWIAFRDGRDMTRYIFYPVGQGLSECRIVSYGQRGLPVLREIASSGHRQVTDSSWADTYGQLLILRVLPNRNMLRYVPLSGQ